MIEEATHQEQAYEHACKAVEHYRRLLLEGGMDEKQLYFFRIQLIKAVGQKVQSARMIETS